MEPKFQTSFIPKTPIVSGSSSFTGGAKVSVNILGTFVVLFFITSILASVGVFGFTYYLKSQIESSNTALSEARAAFDSSENKNILLVSDQLKSIRVLLTNHKVVSPLFQILEKETLPTVKLTSFVFNRDAISGGVFVNIKMEAQNYASLAQQSKLFIESKAFKSIDFSGATLTDVGTVETTIKAMINPDITLYINKLQTLSVVSNISS
jgi:hypothetical protein